jgi:hypothetical protein
VHSAPVENTHPHAASAFRTLRISHRKPLARRDRWRNDMTRKRTILPTALAAAALAFAAVAATPTLAQMKEQTVTVGGAPM